MIKQWNEYIGFWIKSPPHISMSQMTDLLKSGLLLRDSKHGPKVVQRDHLIYKVFYRRKRFTKKIVFPKAKYFIRNAAKLRRLQILSPTIQNYFYCKEDRADMVVYPNLPGESMNDFLERGDLAVIPEFARFLAELHKKGVFFRAIHMGNVLFTGEEFALLDIDNIYFSRRPLTLSTIIRNFKHLVKHDKHLLITYGITNFLKEYAKNAALTPKQQEKLILSVGAD